jgi:hypothetical protein
MKIYLLFAALLSATATLARDNGQWAQADPEIKQWFNGLQSVSRVLCCSFADGLRIDDVDWRRTSNEDYPFQVHLEGQWVDVPAAAVVSAKNRVGYAIVWPVMNRGERIAIRCFMAGQEI